MQQDATQSAYTAGAREAHLCLLAQRTWLLRLIPHDLPEAAVIHIVQEPVDLHILSHIGRPAINEAAILGTLRSNYSSILIYASTMYVDVCALSLVLQVQHLKMAQTAAVLR